MGIAHTWPHSSHLHLHDRQRPQHTTTHELKWQRCLARVYVCVYLEVCLCFCVSVRMRMCVCVCALCVRIMFVVCICSAQKSERMFEWRCVLHRANADRLLGRQLHSAQTQLRHSMSELTAFINNQHTSMRCNFRKKLLQNIIVAKIIAKKIRIVKSFCKI